MPQDAKPKVDKIEVRIESELAKRAKLKALQHGGLSAVVRALIKLWLEKDIVSAEEIARANERAAKRKKDKD